MAIAAGQWHSITIKGFADAAWDSVLFPASMPREVGNAIRDGTALFVYCVDDAGPLELAFNGGRVAIDATLIATESAETMNTTTLADSTTWVSVRTTDGGWEWYDDVAGIVRRVESPETLGAFLGFI